ncbi:MAG: type II toxin-antitoxin system RelE/ParE family toxin [Desulfovibrio sp.]|jgi:phage-related protein|nr:type II toxin-antitoxin system RelE/ParE family toxin [Desulfovibrio sp.]
MPGAGTPWIVENLNELVDAEFDMLPRDIQAKFMHLAALVEDVGLTALREPYVKHLQGKLWELRVKAKSGLGRGLYCTVAGRRVIVLRYFQKQSGKTPRKEIVVALERIRLVEE